MAINIEIVDKMPIVVSKEIRNRFWSKANIKESVEECWLWKGWVRDIKKPYGKFSIGFNRFTAHRFSYYLHTGVNPKELHVLHKCDNPRCINPNHLFLGTNADNVADKVLKNRQARNPGKRGLRPQASLWLNKGTKLTKDKFLEAKDIYEKKGISLDKLAEQYGTSKRTLAKAFRKLGGIVEPHARVLTKEKVLSIRNEYIPLIVSSNILAKKYGVGQKTILDIIHRKTWQQL